MSEVIPSDFRILLVEDDNDDVLFFKDALHQLKPDHEVAVASNCQQLFSQLELDAGFDLIFIDINLPLMNGKECLRQIKSSEKYRDVPIIMFTGSSADIDVEETYACGAHYHVVKPYAHINYVESLRVVFTQDWKSKPPQPAREKFVVNLTYN